MPVLVAVALVVIACAWIAMLRRGLVARRLATYTAARPAGKPPSGSTEFRCSFRTGGRIELDVPAARGVCRVEPSVVTLIVTRLAYFQFGRQSATVRLVPADDADGVLELSDGGVTARVVPTDFRAALQDLRDCGWVSEA